MLRDINLLALRLKIFAKKRDLLISLLRDTYLSKERIFTRLYIGNKTREENIGERKLREVEVGYAEGKWMRVWGRRGAGEGGGGGEGGGICL